MSNELKNRKSGDENQIAPKLGPAKNNNFGNHTQNIAQKYFPVKFSENGSFIIILN